MKGNLFCVQKVCFLCLSMISTYAYGQTMRTVTGTITEKNGQPVIGANVTLKGSKVGTITDFNGVYSLKVPIDKATLVISYIGFKTVEDTLTPNRNKYDFTFMALKTK